VQNYDRFQIECSHNINVDDSISADAITPDSESQNEVTSYQQEEQKNIA